MHDLAESLIVEARVVQSGDAEVRLVQCVAPGPDPLFPVAIVMPITRDGRWRKYEDRKSHRKVQDRGIRRAVVKVISTPSGSLRNCIFRASKHASRTRASDPARHATKPTVDGRKHYALGSTSSQGTKNLERAYGSSEKYRLLSLWNPEGHINAQQAQDGVKEDDEGGDSNDHSGERVAVPVSAHQ